MQFKLDFFVLKTFDCHNFKYKPDGDKISFIHEKPVVLSGHFPTSWNPRTGGTFEAAADLRGRQSTFLSVEF